MIGGNRHILCNVSLHVFVNVSAISMIVARVAIYLASGRKMSAMIQKPVTIQRDVGIERSQDNAEILADKWVGINVNNQRRSAQFDSPISVNRWSANFIRIKGRPELATGDFAWKAVGRENVGDMLFDTRDAHGAQTIIDGISQGIQSSVLRYQLGFDSNQVLNRDRKSRRLNSSHANISYAVFCL